MVREYVYAPHHGFFINKISRPGSYEMSSFHFHKKYEIYYQVSGTRTYFIGDSSYLIEAGNLVLIDKDEPHKTGSPDDSPHTRIVINFVETYIDGIAQNLEDVDLFKVFQSKIKVLTLSAARQAQVERQLNRMLESDAHKGPEADALCRLQLCELLLMVGSFVKAQSGNGAPSGEPYHPAIHDVIAYISAHYSESLSLQTLADKFLLSPSYLSRLFKKNTHVSIIDYINSVRMQEAKKLLEETKEPISVVAEQVGFHTTTHFTRTFKTSTGMSPQNYRRTYHV